MIRLKARGTSYGKEALLYHNPFGRIDFFSADLQADFPDFKVMDILVPEIVFNPLVQLRIGKVNDLLRIYAVDMAVGIRAGIVTHQAVGGEYPPDQVAVHESFQCFVDRAQGNTRITGFYQGV